MSRRCPSWIDSFIIATENKGSPQIFRRWAAISAIAGALDRKTFVYTKASNLYPNLYVFLVGPPGVGKGQSLDAVEFLWRALPQTDYHIAPTSVTKASLVDFLKDAKTNHIRHDCEPSHLDYNSLQVLSRELGTFMTTYDGEFVNFMTDVWDGKPYSETRRSKDVKVALPRTFINLIAGTTPSFLNTFLPIGAWDQGFMSRVICIHSAELIVTDLFPTGIENDLPPDLISDFRLMSKLYGQFIFTEEAKLAIMSWYESGAQPAPMHPKLVHYNARRAQNLLKLSMIISASRRDTMKIEIDDFEEARAYLEDAEEQMPDIFKVGGGGDSKAIDDAWFFIYTTNLKSGGKGVSEARLYAWLSQKIPAFTVPRVIEAMEKGGTIQLMEVNGQKVYLAGGKPGIIP